MLLASPKGGFEIIASPIPFSLSYKALVCLPTAWLWYFKKRSPKEELWAVVSPVLSGKLRTRSLKAVTWPRAQECQDLKLQQDRGASCCDIQGVPSDRITARWQQLSSLDVVRSCCDLPKSHRS